MLCVIPDSGKWGLSQARKWAIFFRDIFSCSKIDNMYYKRGKMLTKGFVKSSLGKTKPLELLLGALTAMVSSPVSAGHVFCAAGGRDRAPLMTRSGANLRQAYGVSTA